MNAWWKLTTGDCLKTLESDEQRGLSTVVAQRRLADAGPNALVERGLKSPWLILWEQLTGILVVILILAAIVSAFLHEYADAVVIGIIVILNSLLGLSQEYRAEKAMAALKRLAVPSVRVRRDGELKEIPSHDLVPGDIIILEAGNLVPADCRLLETVNLRIQEASLTGESEPVEKEATSQVDENSALADRFTMAYMGTVVTYGRAQAVVCETGMRTELGHIANMIQTVQREPTPLQKRLEQLGHGLALAALILVAVIFAEGLFRDGLGMENLKLMFLTAISMAVAAVPEGLPAIVTIALALGAQRMLKRHALIRKLLAVETLGSVTVICSDKTGTLTENRMTVTTLHIGGETISMTGAGHPSQPGSQPLLAAGALCNDAILKAGTDERGQRGAIGDPTETALVMAALSAGLDKQHLEQNLPRIAEAPFDSERKRMTTVHRLDDQHRPDFWPTLWCGIQPAAPLVAFCKGAADGLLSVCTKLWMPNGILPLTSELREKLQLINNNLAQSGMRVLGVAFRPMKTAGPNEPFEQDLIFLGMIGMIDPPRQEVKQAVATCLTAGIRPIMITGDHPLTAREIARQLGLATNGDILTGAELDRLSADELKQRVETVSVYARVSPEHKLKIVDILQQSGHVVAMTGDGVNDAPALRKADIGVAMGITGTDVSKEAADMVLQDDNFATIVAAIEEGRVIYDNIRKFIRYLLSTNSGELWVMLLAPFLGLPLPLLPIQILWMNLVTDGLPALALGIEPAERDIMQREPRRTDENIFANGMGWQVLWAGALMGFVVLATASFHVWTGRLNMTDPHDLDYYRTMTFTIMAMIQMGSVMAIRSQRDSLFKQGLFSNKPLLGAVLLTTLMQMALIYVPFLQKCFQTVALNAFDLAICLILSTSVFWAIELEKLWIRRHHAP